MWNLKKNGTNELIYKTEVESQISNKDLLYSTGSSTQYSGNTVIRKASEKE